MGLYYADKQEFIEKLYEARDILFSLGYEFECDAVTQAVHILEKENAD